MKYCVDCWWFDANKRAGEYTFEGSSLCQNHLVLKRSMISDRPEKALAKIGAQDA